MAKLYFRYGAMNAGKSAALLQVVHNYKEKNMKGLIIKPKIDTKGDNKVVSRIGLSSSVDILLDIDESLFSIQNQQIIKDSNCIIVDEAQFLSTKQVDELWIITKQLDIPVICYGLRTDSKTHLFTGSKRLMEIADEIEELATICSCGKKARFNARIIDGKYTTEGDTIAIDDNDSIKYESLCGKCFLQKVLRKF
ncbi:MAG: thymidine kinase [Bacilli bacterium]|nr:thymidine kinase [Bacilli bacterium]